MELFQKWLEAPVQREPSPEGLTRAELEAAPWLAITRRAVRHDVGHDMDEICAAIAHGWGSEAAEKAL